MAVFKDCFVLLELKTLPFKEKKNLKSAITENGGSITFVVNKQCSLVVTSDVSSLSSNRLRSIQKHQTPVVGVDYVFSSLNAGILLPVDDYKLDVSITEQESHQVSKVPARKAFPEPPNRQLKPKISETPERSGNVLERFRIYTETDSDLPTFPDNFEVAKYSVFQKTNSNTWCVLELQSVKGDNGRQYRVVCYWMNDIEAKKAAVKDKLVFLPTSEDALEVYLALRENLQSTGLQLRSNIPSQAQDLGSGPLQQLLLEEKLNTGSLSQEVGVFVELLWTEALGCLENILQVPIDGLSLNDVSRAEGLLLQAQRKLKEGNHTEAESLLEDVYTLLPHRAPQLPPSAKLISQKLDLCQLIRDVLNVSEMTLRSPAPSSVGKYRALRCSIELFCHGVFVVNQVLQISNFKHSLTSIYVMRVNRGVELQMFKSEVGNIKPLLHSSSPSNFVGILSRGLLLPRVGVELHGIQRTDVGNLGSGIYFSDAMSTSVKYTKPSETDGSRMLLVCDVALGCCRDLHKRDFTLTQAPEGHHSVHGVRCTANVRSEFQDDEYVVYSPDQIKLKYVVQFSVDGDQLKEFSPAISTSAEVCLPSTDQGDIKNPLEDVTAGLLDSSGQQLPLQAVHVKCKLMDLLSQVIIFQKYTNTSSVPIEAKYVFPLDDSAAVCGFEAFINGKHVVGQVKEKETARKEYKQAIERGHGAYLMDQDAPDVFTISVGNLPPGATVLIKVTFVSELIVRDGSVFFSLPGSVAPWQESAALNQTTQVRGADSFTLDMSVEMPYEISRLQCITHQVKTKRTDCKAVVSVLPGQVMGSEGFQLSITLSDVHLPRMWVEKHPDKDSQACMLVFYPDFDISSSSASDEVILLLDTSESMRGESLCTAQRIALQILKTLDHNLKINVILFGTVPKFKIFNYNLFLTLQNKCFTPVGGSTELWRPLQALNLLPPTRGIRNILLLSDGHIQNAELTLKLLRENAQHSRLFTCGLSPTANRHMLRALAQAGGGAYEFFDTKTKHNWQEKVKRMASPGCNSVSVKWQQFSLSAPTPVQAPKQIHALFSDCHTLVYGFVPHCTQATLLGNLSGQELKTMVSTSELQKTRGTFLHKLTARALIRDFEDGNLHTDEAEHEGKKAELKSYIIELSKEFSILSQFTSFVAIEERDSEQTDQGFTDVPKLIAEEDVDILPYISWTSQEESDDYYEDDEDNYVEVDYCYEKCKMMDMNLNYEDEVGQAVCNLFREGYWELTTELGELINVDVDTFTNVFLKSRGINSLGENLETIPEYLHLLVKTDFLSRPEWWEEVKRAVDWVCWADRQYPCAYSRLEFGLSWESSTRQLLGHERLPPFSPLSGLHHFSDLCAAASHVKL
uniref:Poly [ADP-ribose] polymerase n=1 Tax=Anabas testudineus TaxID=64144 RepID=A0A7N6BL54_ANATE